MKKTTIAATFVATILSVSAVQADHHGEPQYAALEGVFCNYKDGKGLKNVLGVAGEMKEWASENMSVDYSAWVMTPFISNSNDFPYDYFWLGMAKDHQSLGTANDEFINKGESMQKKWDRIESCDGRNLMTGMVAHPYMPSSEESGPAFVQIQGCELSDGKTMADVMVADKKWSSYMQSSAMPGGVLRWLPFAGDARDSTTDLYSVYVAETMADRGKAHDMMMKGGGSVLQSTYGDVMTCDTPRIYQSMPVM